MSGNTVDTFRAFGTRSATASGSTVVVVILVFDTEGEVFARLRELSLGLPLWRVTDASRLDATEKIDLAIVATTPGVTWESRARGAQAFGTLLLTPHYDRDHALAALRFGFIGYLGIRMRSEALRAAILGCLSGEPGYERTVLGRWLREQNACALSHANGALLTARQREVLRLVAQGLADKEVGERLGIATVTAQKHMTNILGRLQVSNRAAAVAAVCGLAGLLRPTEVPLRVRPTLAVAS